MMFRLIELLLKLSKIKRIIRAKQPLIGFCFHSVALLDKSSTEAREIYLTLSPW